MGYPQIFNIFKAKKVGCKRGEILEVRKTGNFIQRRKIGEVNKKKKTETGEKNKINNNN